MAQWVSAFCGSKRTRVQTPSTHIKAGCSGAVCNPSTVGQKKQIAKTFWSASLAETEDFRFSERLCLKNEVEVTEGDM